MPGRTTAGATRVSVGAYLGPVVNVLALVVPAIVVLVRRHHIERHRATEATS